MHWVDEEIFKLFVQFHEPMVLQRLGCGATSTVEASQQNSTLSSFLELLVCTASERAWYMLQYTYTFPEQWAGHLAPLREGLDAFNEFKEIAQLIIKAELTLGDPNHSERVVPRLQRFHKLSDMFCFFYHQKHGMLRGGIQNHLHF